MKKIILIAVVMIFSLTAFSQNSYFLWGYTCNYTDGKREIIVTEVFESIESFSENRIRFRNGGNGIIQAMWATAKSIEEAKREREKFIKGHKTAGHKITTTYYLGSK